MVTYHYVKWYFLDNQSISPPSTPVIATVRPNVSLVIFKPPGI